jgi:hypothetical protein
MKTLLSILTLTFFTAQTARADNLLSCTDGDTTISAAHSADGTEIELRVDSVSGSSYGGQRSSIFDLVGPADFPFNSQVKLVTKEFISSVDLRLSFSNPMIQIRTAKGIRRIPCKADADFLAELQKTLKDKTAGAM